MTPRDRLTVFVEPDHARRLAQLSTQKGVSKSAIVAAALASYLSPDGGDRREAALTLRLDRMVRLYDRLERDQTILIETVALFIRHYLTVSTPLAAAHQEAALAQGRQRFSQFVDQLSRRLAQGKSLVKEVHQELFPDQSRFFNANDAPTPSEPAS